MTPNTEVAREQDSDREFFAMGRTVRSFLEVADGLCQRGAKLCGAALTTTQSVPDLVRRLSEGRGRIRGFSITGGDDGLFLIEAPIRNREGEKTDVARAFFWQQANSDLCFLMTIQPVDLFDFLLNEIHEFLQPELCRIYLRTSHIEDCIRAVSKDHPNLRIRVSSYVARKWRESRTVAGKVDTTVQYCDEEVTSVFQKLAAEGQWLSLLRLHTSGFKDCTGRIARQSTFACSRGFEFFFRQFVGEMAQRALAQRAIYENRGRISSPTHASKPLKIVYKTGVFADTKNNYRLIEVLQKLTNSALSVFHPNPYLHASLIDYADGSSYSVLVTTSTGILITPERKATTQSLARLCEYICDNFEEGDVVEFIPQ